MRIIQLSGRPSTYLLETYYPSCTFRAPHRYIQSGMNVPRGSLLVCRFVHGTPPSLHPLRCLADVLFSTNLARQIHFWHSLVAKLYRRFHHAGLSSQKVTLSGMTRSCWGHVGRSCIETLNHFVYRAYGFQLELFNWVAKAKVIVVLHGFSNVSNDHQQIFKAKI